MAGFRTRTFVLWGIVLSLLPCLTPLLIPPEHKYGFHDYCGTMDVSWNDSLTEMAKSAVNITLMTVNDKNMTKSEDDICKIILIVLRRIYHTRRGRRSNLNGRWLGGPTFVPISSTSRETFGGRTDGPQKPTPFTIKTKYPPMTGFRPVTVIPPVTGLGPFTGFPHFTGFPPEPKRPKPTKSPVTTIPSSNSSEEIKPSFPMLTSPTVAVSPRPVGLPPMFALMRILAKMVLTNRQNDCKKKGGSYDSAAGVCVIGFQGNDSRLHEALSLIDAENRRVITLIGNFFSIPALLTVLLVYGHFRELRNIPGKNMICLSLCMLLVHILQTIVIYMHKYSKLCRATGALLHWAYLVTFSWTSIIALDLALTFVPKPRKRVSKAEQFTRYVILGFTIPTIIVIAYVITDASTDRLVGYGIASYCFIVRFWPTLSFLIVVVLVLLFNIICVILATRAIYSSQKSTKRVLSKERYPRGQIVHLMLIVLKISTVVGLGWVFGILGSAISSSILMYLFLILVNFQGVFVFVAFVCNRRIWRLCHLFYKANFDTGTSTASTHVVMTNVTSYPTLSVVSDGKA